MNKIRKGDEVVVIAGRDKGRRGNVLTVLDDHLVVEGINVVKKHVKPNPPGVKCRAASWIKLRLSHLQRDVVERGGKEGDRVAFVLWAMVAKCVSSNANKEVVDA